MMTMHKDLLLADLLAAGNPTTASLASRRSLLRRGITFGFAAPFAAPALRGFAQEGHDDAHGPDEASTPEPEGVGSDASTEKEHGGAEDEHGGADGEHTEAPVPSGPVQPFVLYDPYLPAATPGPKDITMVARDATLLIANDVPFAGWTYDGTVPGAPSVLSKVAP